MEAMQINEDAYTTWQNWGEHKRKMNDTDLPGDSFVDHIVERHMTVAQMRCKVGRPLKQLDCRSTLHNDNSFSSNLSSSLSRRFAAANLHDSTERSDDDNLSTRST